MLGEILREVVADSSRVVIAAPYLKADALAWLLSWIRVDAELCCMTRWRPADIVQGASDVLCRQLVLEHNGSFLLHPNMHAKLYRGDDRALVGSANVSWSALGDGPSANLEILCAPAHTFDVHAFEAQLLREARSITDAEFRYWQSLELSKDDMPLMLFAREETSSASDWKPLTRDPKHLWWAYRGESRLVPSEGELIAARADLAELELPADLDRSAFNLWLAGCLLSSAFVVQVKELWDRPADDKLRTVAVSWGMSLSTSARSVETAEVWLHYFLPGL